MISLITILWARGGRGAGGSTHLWLFFQKWGWRMGEELSLYTFLIVHGFMKIMYYLGNEKIKMKRISWEMRCFAWNAVLSTCYSLYHLFSHFSRYCGRVMQNKAWALIIALIPGTIAEIMRSPLQWQCPATPYRRQDKHPCRCRNNHLSFICHCPGISRSALVNFPNNRSLPSV